MEVDKILNKIKSLNSIGIGLRQPEAIAELHSVYLEAFGESVVVDCGGCVKKAYGRLQLLTKDKLIIMKDSKFKVNEDVVLPVGEFGSGEFLTKDNLTDDLAYRVLEQNPGLIKYFADFPKDSKGELIPRDKTAKAKAPAKDKSKATSIDGSKDPVDEVPAAAKPETPATDINGSGETVTKTELSDEEIEDELPEVIPPATEEDKSPADDASKTEDEIKSYLSNVTRPTLVAQYVAKFNAEPSATATKKEIYLAITA